MISQDEAQIKALYNTKRWQRLRTSIVERDKGIDQRTGRIITGRYVVDHIKPATLDNFWDPDNLQLLSIESHNDKTFKELSISDFRKEARKERHDQKANPVNEDLINY